MAREIVEGTDGLERHEWRHSSDDGSRTHHEVLRVPVAHARDVGADAEGRQRRGEGAARRQERLLSMPVYISGESDMLFIPFLHPSKA